MINGIKYTIGVLLALGVLSIFFYLIYQPVAKSVGFPSCCELKCKWKGHPDGSCLRSDEVESNDVHEKYGPCWNPIDEHCSFPGICRCMCDDPNFEEEYQY